MISFIQNSKTWLWGIITHHKVIALISAALVVYGGYNWYVSANTAAKVTTYVLEKATQGTVIASVSGSGQVQPVTSVNVKSQVTETVTRVLVKVGDHVGQGQALVQLDPTTEVKAVTQAKLSLQSANISLAKLQEAPAITTLAQDEDAVTQAQESLVNASTTLQKDYQSGFNTVAAAVVDFQAVISGLQDFVLGTEVNKVQSNPDAYVSLMPYGLQDATKPYRDLVDAKYSGALTSYQANLLDYHSASRASDMATLDALFTETLNTAKMISEAVKAEKDLLNYVSTNFPIGGGLIQLPSVTATFQTNVGGYTTTMNSNISNLSNAAGAIVSDRTSISDARLSLKEKQNILAALQAGPDTLDVQSQQLSIAQQEANLQTAEQNLGLTTVRAPIAGVVSAIAAIVGETVASPAVSMIGSGNLAQITLNEVDAAKVTVGEKSTITFDALPDLSLAGQVIEVSPVGTVSQGVVNYSVKVSFDDQSNQVKPGMSVTANIVTLVHADVIAVPNSAITTQGGQSYVLEPAAQVSDAQIASSAQGGIALVGTPQRVPVTVGLTNDTLTEITSGISAGNQIIIRTISATASTASTAATGGTSALRLLGGGGFGGGGGGTRTGGGAAAGR